VPWEHFGGEGTWLKYKHNFVAIRNSVGEGQDGLNV
jgi:hypothetical protein